MLQKGVSVDRASLMTYNSGDADKSEPSSVDRKLVHTAAIDITVKSQAQCTEKIIRLAQDTGGSITLPALEFGR